MAKPQSEKKPNLYNPLGGVERCFDLIASEIEGYTREGNANQLKIMQFSRLGVMVSYGFPRPMAVKLFNLAAKSLDALQASTSPINTTSVTVVPLVTQTSLENDFNGQPQETSDGLDLDLLAMPGNEKTATEAA